MKYHFRNESIEPLHRTTTFDLIRDFVMWFVKDIGIFKTFAFFGGFLIAINLVKAIPLLQDALLTQKLDIGEYISCVLLVCLFLFVICLYGFCYMDNAISKALDQ